MSALRQEYWDTTNQYIIDLYKRANDMYNSVAQSAAWDMAQYNNLLATYSWGWSGGSSSSSTPTPTPDSLWRTITNYIPFRDSEWNRRLYATYSDWTTNVVDENWNDAPATWNNNASRKENTPIIK